MSNAQYLASLVNSSGNINIPVSNAGINFNNSSAIGASTLTDYETGTWTPAFQTGTFTYNRQVGYYTKVGNIVTVGVGLLWATNSGGSGVISINLPFTLGGTTYGRATGSFGYVSGLSFTSGTVPEITSTGGTTNLNVFAIANGGGAPTQLLNSNLSSSGEIQFSMTYIANF